MTLLLYQKIISKLEKKKQKKTLSFIYVQPTDDHILYQILTNIKIPHTVEK